MLGIEPRISDVGSDRSANCVTTTAPISNLSMFYSHVSESNVCESTAAAISKWRNFSPGFNAIKSISIIAFALEIMATAECLPQVGVVFTGIASTFQQQIGTLWLKKLLPLVLISWLEGLLLELGETN